jgi:hypothetical protein
MDCVNSIKDVDLSLQGYECSRNSCSLSDEAVDCSQEDYPVGTYIKAA